MKRKLFLGKDGNGQKIIVVKLKKPIYKSLVKQGITEIKVIETRDNYVFVSVSAKIYDRFIYPHKYDQPQQ